jgi:hypothetical protein
MNLFGMSLSYSEAGAPARSNELAQVLARVFEMQESYRRSANGVLHGDAMNGRGCFFAGFSPKSLVLRGRLAVFVVKEMAVDVGPELLEPKGTSINRDVQPPLETCIPKGP